MFGFIQKQCPENFAQLNLRILELFTREFVFFLKSRLIFKRFYCFSMFVNKHFTNTGSYISKCKQCQNEKPSAYYFNVKTKISLDFHICISVPLIADNNFSFPYSATIAKRCSVKKVFLKNSAKFIGGVLRNFAKFRRKHLRQSLFFNKVSSLRTPFLQNTSRRLLLYRTLQASACNFI